MMLKRLMGLLLALALTGCGGGSQESRQLDDWIETENELRVLCTIGMLEDIVSQIGGEKIATITLIGGELDPHSYELVKGDDEKIAYADLVFYCGLGLEHGPSLRTHLEENEKAIAVGDRIYEQDPEAILIVDGMPDPHIWMDIDLWMRAARIVAKVLSEKLPEQSELFEANLQALLGEMRQADEEIQAIMQRIPVEQRYLVTSHDAFNYFGRAYLAEPEERADGSWQKRVEAPEGLSPEASLSVLDIKRLIDHLETYHITVLFPESNVSKDSLRKIANAGSERKVPIKMAQEALYADAMGPKNSDGDTYLKMIIHNARVIERNLNGDMMCNAK